MHPAVSRLTLDEKLSLLTGDTFWSTRSVEHAGVDGALLTDGPHGVRLQSGSADHLGLNESEPATAFPTAAATGSTWDPELLEEMGRALGRESRALGVDVLLGPGVNIKRSPLCGRNFEYFSEDPLLAGSLGAGWVRGIQSQGVGASLKHFAANNQETERMRVSAEVDERTLREIYLPAFERAVTDAQPATVMCSYNRINGVYASQNRWLLTDVLRDEWGYEGYVVSDWGAVVDPPAAVAAGLDLTMPAAGERHAQDVRAALEAGELDETAVDLAVSRILTVHDRLREGRGETEAVDVDAHHALARRIAAESSVLLANDGGLLPLAADASIAVVGEFARTPRYQGAGSSHINPTRLDTALDAVRAAASAEVPFAAGFRLDGREDAALVDEAVAAARAAAVVVLFLGLPDEEESEGFDRTHIDLPAVQRSLLDAVLAVNERVVVVLSNGSVVSLDGIAGRVPAILETWLGGQASGSAVADVLFGAAEPGGRLAETIPLRLADNPAHVNFPGTPKEVVYGERVYVGYRWYDRTEREVAFPFGFGLGYTTFALSDLAVSVPDPARAHAVVEITATNTGDRAGSEVVQVYVGDPEASVDRPVRELRAFRKVRLAAGESARVRLELDERAFAFWGGSGWTVEPGAFAIEVGTSSRDIAASAGIALDVPAPVFPLDVGSTVGDWRRHPVGAAMLDDAIAEAGGQAAAIVADEEMARMLESMPLRTLLGFGGEIDGTAAVEDLLAKV
ncbi:glycoside hydrolase family 3 C-terminal domain-containing protein [Microbacterium betulae]|uniref:Exo-alpha-(1->6)-L-arabinopyranosidase n=1 Tax=Microbacterium betulae TaxID=2981139 RepID=A0AA97I6N5_9MICO|nr:glycoside hydrolase family 3 C-terminal domain-containing protein [Microbacterium sp. AB]WOF23337.1 glycoside hydrolase family 3 C-terminal domain-containing protein [Microbacterium sp. AB]